MDRIDSSQIHPQLDLAKPSDIVSFLEDTPFACTKADPLSGGNANFVFRLHLCKPFEGRETLVLKHGKTYMSSNSSLTLTLERQHAEAQAMLRLNQLLPAGELVTVPTVHHYDKVAHVIIMDDAGPGSCTLKQLLTERPGALSPAAAREIGTALGNFARTVHRIGTRDEALMEIATKNGEMKGISARYTYGRLVNTLRGDRRDIPAFDPPLDVQEETLTTIQDMAMDCIEGVSTSSQSFTVGDFWTGNVIVTRSPDDELGSGLLRVGRAFVVDWEVTKLGIPYLDIAQFAAELHTARSFYRAEGGRSAVDELLPAFLSAYVAEKPLESTSVQRAAMHVGAHMVVVTPSVGTWTPRERVREFVCEGVEYLLKGGRGDRAWLEQSILGELLSSNAD